MKTALLIAAIVCFALATFGAPVPVVALVPLGLGLWCASELVGKNT